MKKIVWCLIALIVATFVFADVRVDRSIDMYRDINDRWSGRVYEANIVDNELELWLLGRYMERDECSSRWDLVLEQNGNEIYRGVDEIQPTALYIDYYGRIRGGTYQGKKYVKLDAGTYDNILVRYMCPSNSDWDITAKRVLNTFTIKEEKTSPHTYPYCSWWMRWRGYC